MASKRPFFGVNRVGGPIVQLTESLVDPVAQLVSLFGLMVWYGEEQYNYYIILGILLFSLSFPGKSLIQRTLRGTVLDVLLSWAGVVTLLLFFGWATGLYRLFPSQLIVGLLWITPLLQLAGHLLLRRLLPALVAGSHPKRSVIVGCNELGRHLAAEIDRHPLLGIRMLGYFDDRSADRLDVDAQLIKGDFGEVAEFARRNAIEIIYLAVPMASQPRIVSLLDSLTDTTASVYFVPDVFVTELVQARMDAVGRVPVLAVCDTPFTGLNGTIKRAADIVLSLLILTLIAPLLLLVATMVRLDSPGSVIFRQRRYGLDGKEIIVYKFRSMSVCEDGPLVAQACRGDSRVTRAGAILRKTSLDELPQFINVLQGRMSIVGPRPHAVAHNETYRKLIKGYMVRHKVKPGITGWAQVNGYRGETQTLDKMEGRVAYDLEYLRNWSLKLDLYIIFRTAALVFRDAGAY
ncbi:undecaprenyl-phosphate glucose phosphotransferase [Accumulibacter sp.]|uniref:undecaprenyl-phosphate glucose phosphotransferase n=1 Tax=Accumulibacter sp. TaxID=2053492 RepID=UPI0025D4290A|nr:undecaprenyl-phosphate glucose phosphotransferase [Accumulibacter sp.]MCM8612682.1 undecaprenyl-phosphate glucose phosphotransferase [Accumulibacter sp.]MCM8636478.1 undecaprenyl-phosphate glucose phosphotransferase [Accumulibacter sp.]MCM8639369.1 undecaprenyl-phosphate glucose phosphotransferase [Accumulibacter sp.]